MDPVMKSFKNWNEESKAKDTEDARQCNPSLPVEMELDADKMRGDAIGNTLYSECWVLKILLKLSKFSAECWSKDVETELCLLWDMTVEPDVVQLLMDHNFLELASHVIRETSVARLTEILVGIMGNLCCHSSVRKKLAIRRDLICILLGLLSLPDVPTLLQLMRLLHTCVWDLRGVENSSLELGEQEGLNKNTLDNSVKNDERLDLNIGASNAVANVDSKCTELVNIAEEQQHRFPKKHKFVDLKQKQHCLDLSEKNVEHQDPKQSTSKYCTLHKSNCDDNPAKNKSDDHLQQKSLEQSVELDENLWRQELMDVNKWLPTIIFILNSSTNEQLLCSVLSLLDTLCYIPVGSSFLGNYIVSPAFVMALIETLEQLDREFRRDDVYPNKKLQRAAFHWVSVLSAFTSFSEGRAALGNHARAVNAGLCRHLVLEYLNDPLHEDQAQFIMLAVTVAGALLLNADYFNPKTFNQLLAILSRLRGKFYVQVETNEETGSSIEREIEKAVMDSLEQYFEAVVEWADDELLVHVLQHCEVQHVAILQSIIKNRKSSE